MYVGRFTLFIYFLLFTKLRPLYVKLYYQACWLKAGLLHGLMHSYNDRNTFKFSIKLYTSEHTTRKRQHRLRLYFNSALKEELAFWTTSWYVSMHDCMIVALVRKSTYMPQKINDGIYSSNMSWNIFNIEADLGSSPAMTDQMKCVPSRTLKFGLQKNAN